MPWFSKDASKFSKKANTPAKSRQWMHIANSALSRTGSDATAIKEANGVIKKHPSQKAK